MSIEAVKEYLKAFGKDTAVMELGASAATVELAARAAGVSPQRIAKTLSFTAASAGACILVVAAGDARIDGKKFKVRFGIKSKMLNPEKALALTGHAVGGVCPFAIQNPGAAVYLDVSLRRFATVFPACGSDNSIIELSCDELHALSRARGWVDVCKGWQEPPAAVSGRIIITAGDITTMNVDAIVNAANTGLRGGGGVDGAIHRAAGSGLLAECRTLDGCPTGHAKSTGGYNLPARHVIHAVGPIWQGGDADEDALLRCAYDNSLREALLLGAQSVAFPAIATGAYGFPKDRAARIAVDAVRDFLKEHALPRVVYLVCFSEESAAEHRKALAEAP